MTDTKRKGARAIKDIPAEILEQLNKGEIATVNLTEWLALDQITLLENILINLKRDRYIDSIKEEIESLKKQTVNTIGQTIGFQILALSKENNDTEVITLLSNHVSDMARCWAAHAIGRDNLSFEEKISNIQKFAADEHFGVREISWLAVRADLAKDVSKSVSYLIDWTTNESENIRRFASESIRPRGVWCEHIDLLKKEPEIALPLLEKLKSDPSKYVQDSVGNWLNDASKTQPEFVINVCSRWEKESPTKETKYIIKKALRTINK